MSSHDAQAGTVLTVVHEPGAAAPGSALVFELCGPLGTAQAEAVAARIATRHRAYGVALEEKAGRYLVRLSRAAAAPGPKPGPPTAELLADLLQPPCLGTVPVTGHQRELLLAAVNRPGAAGRHIEQLHWSWSGPLDPGRFTAAWQSVTDREVVLRASFDWTGTPRLVLHERAAVEVVHHRHTTVSWNDLLRRDRAREFALHRPGLLRLTLLDGPPGPGATGPAATGPAATGPAATTRILLSYPHALLDERGAQLLVREFYRAYLADGVVPGGERRPDIRDHVEWLRGQDTDVARRFWATAAPPAHAAVSPGRPGGRTRNTGPGRIQRRLRPHQTARLRSWAAAWGAGESSALHAVWALLLYRAAGVPGPAPVSFGMHLSGRDLMLRGAADIPGLLGNPLPVTVTVDPAAPLVDLLRQVRDAALDLSAYPWVSGDLIREWSGRDPGDRLTDTLVRFDTRPELPRALRCELNAHGIRVDVPQSVSSDTSLPVTLVARHDPQGGLTLTATHDRAGLSDADASGTLSQCMHLLRLLPDHHDERVTVAQVLDLLRAGEVPPAARQEPGPRGHALAVLRAGDPRADVIGLVMVPGVPPGAYDLLLSEYDGPERIVSLALDDASGLPPPSGLRELGLRGPGLSAPGLSGPGLSGPGMREAPGTGRRLVLCGCGPAGRVAYEIARDVPHGTDGPTTVVMTGTGDAAGSARALLRGLESVRARSV
ncbi:condensation domain-containing protein [Streptomyces sp. CNZ748]|uniref:condensation domain-containing protein n=1 Tax=Streptomyces sp. CNZ748 TaxID=2885160 RepID=UPI001E2BFC54|nr:condensation domain-containing protein [Streptomyces sp. CNZ748]